MHKRHGFVRMIEYEIHFTWTPTKPLSKYVQIGSIFFHNIIRTQISIYLGLTLIIIHKMQWLIFNCLSFENISIKKKLIYKTTSSY